MSWVRKILLFASIVLPVALMALLSYFQIRQNTIERILDERRSLASLSAHVLKAKLDHVRDLGLSIAARSLVRQLVAEQKWEAAMAELTQMSRALPYIDRVFVADTTGTLMTDVPSTPAKKGLSYAQTDDYKEFMKTRQPYLSEVYKRLAPPHERVSALVLPIKNEAGKMQGIFAIQINIAALMEWRKEVIVGNSGFVYVVDQKGHIAINPEYSETDSIVDYSSVPAVQKALKGERNVEILYNPIAGENRLIAYEQIAGYGWAVIVQQEESAALAEGNSLRFIAIIYFLVILAVFVLAWFITREMDLRKKTETALVQSNKSLEQKVEERTTELSNAVKNLNESLERFSYATLASNEIIYDWKISEDIIWWNDRYFVLIGIEKERDWLPIESWSAFIHPEDHDRVLKSVNDFLESKETHWTGEYRFLDKKGNVHFFDDRAYAIRDQNGTPFRLIGAVTDITVRKKTEEALKASENYLRAIVKAEPECVKLLNINNELEDMNPAGLAMIDADNLEQVKGKCILNIINEPYRQAFDALTRKVFAGNPGKMEFEITGLKGTHRWLETHTVPLKDAQGNIISSLAVTRDITNRKRADETLRLALFAIDNAADTILWINPDGRIVNVNEAACRMLGFTRQELLQFSIPDIDPNIKFEEWPNHFDELRQKGSIVLETRQQSKDGRLIPVEVTANYIKFNDQELNCAFVRDITERKKSEQSLKDLNTRLKLATGSAQIGIFDWDIPTNQLIWDDNMYKIFGVPPEKFNGAFEAWSNTVHPDDLSKGLAEVQAAIDGTKDFHTFFRIIWPNNEVRFVEGHAVMLRDAAGKAIRMIGVNRDITERKKAEEQIISLNQTLENKVEERTGQWQAANQELEAFSYSVSHDLRAPLRAIDGYTRILEEDYGDILDADGKKVIATISRNALRMGQLIDDMLSFSRYGRLELSLATINMTDIVGHILHELLIHENDRLIKTNVAKLDNAQGDIDMLRQVWINYISNALKFSANRKETEITIGSRVASGEVCYYIKDNGTGFDNQYAHKLFGVFQRLHKESEFEGTGVGLATCKRIIERHGGRVWAEGEPGKGATFYFSLPTS